MCKEKVLIAKPILTTKPPIWWKDGFYKKSSIWWKVGIDNKSSIWWKVGFYKSRQFDEKFELTISHQFDETGWPADLAWRWSLAKLQNCKTLQKYCKTGLFACWRESMCGHFGQESNARQKFSFSNCSANKNYLVIIFYLRLKSYID